MVLGGLLGLWFGTNYGDRIQSVYNVFDSFVRFFLPASGRRKSIDDGPEGKNGSADAGGDGKKHFGLW